MSRTRILFFSVLILASLHVFLRAQQAGADERWRTLNGELRKSYDAKDWPAALAVLDRMMKLADETKNGEARSAVFYMNGCVRALAGQKAQAVEALRLAFAGGFTDYGKYSGDSDLASLRGDPEFRALLAEIKAKYGAAPIVWDRGRPAGAGICAEWKPFILRNAFYFKIHGDQRSFQRAASGQLVLVPQGAAEPHKFAGSDESVFAGSIYTSNPETFYAPPPSAGR